MTKSFKHTTADGESTKVLAALLRRAEAEGVKPFNSLADYAGEPEMTADFDVDVFLRLMREDRDRPSISGQE